MNTPAISYEQANSFTESDLQQMFDRFDFNDEIRSIVEQENLLPLGLIRRLHCAFPKYSAFKEERLFMFKNKKQYVGLEGFREIVKILQMNGIELDHLEERELFIKVYRFMATRHVLNIINWDNPSKDSLFQLVFPQPGMIRKEIVDAYFAAGTDAEKEKIISEYIRHTHPHDGKQLLNKPIFENEEGKLEVLEGCQHKYPQCELIFDVQTQNCFAFCTYCFRHAQVRGDIDMFLQRDLSQVHRYLRKHKEITDILITGGDAGYLKADRFESYITPIIEDPELNHIRTIRIGTRMLTYFPEMILTHDFERMLNLYRRLIDNGIQILFMSHFSTPREIMNPTTVAAIRRLRNRGVTMKSQSPIMNHISLFTDENGKVDIDRSAQNWIDLGNLLAMLGVGFHSIYMARPTGEHHYFTAPLADINNIFQKVYRSLASINRPSRFITMTSSAGKISMLGTIEIEGEKAFVLKINEGRNMEWMDKIFLAKYDEKETVITRLKPFWGDKFFYEDELAEIEHQLEEKLHYHHV
jgi:L-lysine 2,3-aminomutase